MKEVVALGRHQHVERSAVPVTIAPVMVAHGVSLTS
jgi:hypothetical protein